MSSQLQRLLGGSPAGVLVKLAFLSLLVGALLAFLGLTPAALLRHLVGLFESLLDLGFGSVREVGGWLLSGALIVVPLWLLSRLLAARR